jgi:hypothetical protein
MAQGLFNLKQVMQGIQQGDGFGQEPPAVEYLVVAGGGGGGNGGGGGAGGLLAGVDPVPNGQTLLVTIGNGGNGSTTAAAGVTGGNSVFGNIVANGGGGGSGYQTAGAAGGSGGGGGRSDLTSGGLGGVGISGQGNSGGTGIGSNNTASGGGGGAGTVGLSVFTSGYGGNGGAGITSSISGPVTAYAGGGGAWGATQGSATGGVGGGGTGANGTANTGGGGAGGGYGTGYNGGSGIVIVSYPDVYAAATTTTGTPTVSTSGSGSLSFNGSSQFLSVPTVSGYTLNADFTIEFWANATSYPSTGGGSPCVLSSTNTSNNWLVLVDTGAIAFYWNGSAVLTVTPTNATGSWYHVAVVRSGTTVTIYKNGTSLGTATSAASFTSTSTMNIGQQNTGIGYWAGLLSNVRIVKGTAVYTANFTPSIAPLAPITNTTLLLSAVSGAPCADLSTTAAIPNSSITVAPTWNASSPFTGTGYKNRVYTWTSSGSITF